MRRVVNLFIKKSTIDVKLKNERVRWRRRQRCCKAKKVIEIFVEGGGGGSQFRLMRMALEYSLLTTSNCKKKKRRGEDGKKGEKQDGDILNRITCESFQSGKRMKPGKLWLQTEPMEVRKKKGWGSAPGKKKNKLLFLVTYTIKTGCVMSPFFPFS